MKKASILLTVSVLALSMVACKSSGSSHHHNKNLAHVTIENNFQ